MMKIGHFRIFFLCIFLSSSSPKVFDQSSKESTKYDISYPKHVHGERGLQFCQTNVACNVLHRRFWFNVLVQRLCRCPNLQEECPLTWSDLPDNYTMMLNNRAQMKFCGSLEELPKCTPETTALTLITNKSTTFESFNKTQTREIEHKSAVVYCYCQYPSYWKMQEKPNANNISLHIYACNKLQRCSSNEFCGNMRADYYSTYYQCSCPTNHMCLSKNENATYVSELLFRGLAYQARCYVYP